MIAQRDWTNINFTFFSSFQFRKHPLIHSFLSRTNCAVSFEISSESIFLLSEREKNHLKRFLHDFHVFWKCRVRFAITVDYSFCVQGNGSRFSMLFTQPFKIHSHFFLFFSPRPLKNWYSSSKKCYWITWRWIMDKFVWWASKITSELFTRSLVKRWWSCGNSSWLQMPCIHVSLHAFSPPAFCSITFRLIGLFLFIFHSSSK